MIHRLKTVNKRARVESEESFAEAVKLDATGRQRLELSIRK